MYDRVKRRRKSNEADTYSEEHDEHEPQEGDEEEPNDQNNENDNETKKLKNQKTEQTHLNGVAEDTNEENTMDLLNPDNDDDDEVEEEEEDLSNQQTGKYSLRERKPPIQRFSLHGNGTSHAGPAHVLARNRTTTAEAKDDILRGRRRATVDIEIASITATRVRSTRSFVKIESSSAYRRRVSAHVSSSSTSDSSSDSDDTGPLTNGDLDVRPERTARLAKSTAMKRMRFVSVSTFTSPIFTLVLSRCLPTNLDLLGVYTGAKKPSARATSSGAGSGVGALNLDSNSKCRRANNAAVSLADAQSIEIDRTVRQGCLHFVRLDAHR